MKIRKIYTTLFWCLLAAFVLLNIIAYNNAYHFTHFSQAKVKETIKPEELSFTQKLKVLFMGVRKAKSAISAYPNGRYQTFLIPNKQDTLNAWLLEADSSKGLVISFHGYTSNKSQMLTEAEAFNDLGYNVLLVDQRGHGESTGYTTSIGYYEAYDVAAAFKFAQEKLLADKIYVHGISMGAVAVLRAASENLISPAAIIAECPYGGMLHAAKNRFGIMGVPSFPSAELLVFWGGIQNGFWAFNNNTIADASHIKAPVLLHYGEKDENATPAEIKAIYNNLKIKKQISGFENAGHQSYCRHNPEKWKSNIKSFLDSNK